MSEWVPVPTAAEEMSVMFDWVLLAPDVPSEDMFYSWITDFGCGELTFGKTNPSEKSSAKRLKKSNAD